MEQAPDMCHPPPSEEVKVMQLCKEPNVTKSMSDCGGTCLEGLNERLHSYRLLRSKLFFSLLLFLSHVMEFKVIIFNSDFSPLIYWGFPLTQPSLGIELRGRKRHLN